MDEAQRQAGTGTDAPLQAAKPPVLQETRFVVEEGLAYRVLSRGAIGLNKLWLCALLLLAVWVVYGGVTGAQDCVTTVNVVEGANGTVTDAGEAPTCSVLLTKTSLYLGGMTVISFLLQITFGLLGNVVGRRILEATPASDEVGARRPGSD